LLLQATPHNSTGKSPAELLFNDPLHTQIPTLDNKCYTSPEAQKRDQDHKEAMKAYNDQRWRATE